MFGKKKKGNTSGEKPSSVPGSWGDNAADKEKDEERAKTVEPELETGTESTPLLAREKNKAKAAPQSVEDKRQGPDLEAGLEQDDDAAGDCILCCHMFFVALRTCTILSLVCMATSQILLITGLRNDTLKTILRADIMIFCLLFILVEVDGPAWLMKRFSGVKNFVMRGFLYTYFGLTGMEESAKALEREAYHHLHEQLAGTVASLFIQISSWALMVLGAMYLILGFCCLQGVSDRLRNEHREKRRQRKNRGRV